MKENKNIDRLFQEKFRDFEQDPSAHVWNNIEARLSGKPKRNRKAFWLWFSGIAAGLALLFFIKTNTTYTGTDLPQDTTEINTEENTTTPTSEIVNRETDDTTQETHLETIYKEDLSLTEEITTQNSKTPNYSIKKSTPPKNIPSNTFDNTIKPAKLAYEQKEGLSPVKSDIYNKQQKLAKSIKKKNMESQSNEDTNVFHQKDLIADMNNETKAIQDKKKITEITQTSKKDIKDEEITENRDKLKQFVPKEDEEIALHSKKNKWTVSTMLAPVYLSSFDKKASSLDKSFYNNPKQGTFSAAYGVQIAYQKTERLSFQTGIQKVDYAYVTDDVFVAPSGKVSGFPNIDYIEEASTVNLTPTEMGTSDEVHGSESMGSYGELTQSFGYIEVPLEVKYSIVKGDLARVNAIGGFSTLFLNKNMNHVKTDDISTNLGASNNLNSVNFTGNAGVELEYKLFKNINFNITPMMKIHTHTYSKKANGFSPYAVAVYSGLNYRF